MTMDTSLFTAVNQSANRLIEKQELERKKRLHEKAVKEADRADLIGGIILCIGWITAMVVCGLIEAL